jgi:hypothetical protein
VMPMLPENLKKLEDEVGTVKFILGRVLDFAREGGNKNGRGYLYLLLDSELPYLIYVFDEDEAGRVAEGFHEWINKRFEEGGTQFKR